MHNKINDLKFKVIFTIIILTSLFLKVYLLIIWPQESGDKEIYYILAENIIRGCGLSKSPPELDECILISGTYFPGFPFLISIFWYFVSENIIYLLLFNCLFFTLSFYFLMKAFLLLSINKNILFLLLLLFALSPLQSGWFRFIVLTEPMAISLSLFFLAELIYSISQKKLRVVRFATILACSVFIRPDTILMSISILPVAFYIYNLKEAISKILIFIFLISIPIGSWMTRNILIGHKPISIEESSSPGYIKWTKTWIINEYERGDASFPLYHKQYKNIKIHNSKYIEDKENIKINKLLVKLNKFEYRPFPKIIDKEFEKIANEKIKSRNFSSNLEIYFKRSLYILMNPFSSFGMPFELKSLNKEEFGNSLFSINLKYLINFLNDNYKSVIGKAIIFLYRIIIMSILILSLFRIITNIYYKIKLTKIDILTISITSYFLLRLSFFVTTVELESRYMVESIIWIEALAILFFQRKNKY
ncbi:hypothetical protein OAJ19_00055 [Pelagibacteraceae bacterium]|nr:hypothetical protein [Pelagibacteraceae bacterium]